MRISRIALLIAAVFVLFPLAASAAQEIDMSGPNGAIPDGGSYAYPNVLAGVSQSAVFAITNSGNAPLNLTNIVISGHPFSIIQSPSMTVQPGITTTMRVRTLSAIPGFYTGYLWVYSNDASETKYEINLSVLIQGPVIEVAQDWTGNYQPNGGTATFQTVGKNQSTSRRFQIKNAGTTNVTISSITVSGQGFTLIESPATTVAPGGITYFRVRLISATAGHKTGSVTINNNDPTNNPYVVYLEGEVLDSIFVP